MLKQLLFAVVLVFAGFAAGRASQAAPAHVYELRTYTAADGKLDAVNARFRDHTRQIFEKHHMKAIGYWMPSEGPLAGNTFVYILEHASREDARKSWAEFSADPEWQKARAESEANGRIVAKVDSVFMTPTDYSPTK